VYASVDGKIKLLDIDDAIKNAADKLPDDI
jgi:hypothetical protein